jgi:hypothetical protein
LAISVFPVAARATQANDIGYPTVAAALRGLKARTDVSASTDHGWTVFTDPSARTVWYFTPPGHPANPSVVKRTAITRDGATGYEMKSLCRANKTPCDKLLDEVQQLQENRGQTPVIR